jgi:hypothetical protein
MPPRCSNCEADFHYRPGGTTHPGVRRARSISRTTFVECCQARKARSLPIVLPWFDVSGRLAMKIRYGVGTLLLVLTAACGQSSSPVTPSSSPVTPNPSCSYVLSPSVQPVPIGGGTFTADMTTSSACDWTAAADVPWIVISSESPGIVLGAITYSVAPNSGDIRRGTISAQAPGRGPVTATVIQEGVNY